MEVETPVLNTISGGATARPFITHHNTLDIDMYMRIATELHLKRLIVGGLERVYEIGRIFRNEGMDTKHNPEFTTVELYEAYADFNDMMDLFEDFLSSAAQKILGTYEVTWQGEKIDLAPGWRRMTMAEAVKEYLGVDFMAITDDAEAVAAAKSVGIDMDGVEPTWGHALYECFDQKIEGMLIQPTFITMHPVDVSPLAKRSPKDPRLTERFELFICRSEMGNAFSELNDPIDQKERFQKQVELRAKGDDEAGMMDEDYIDGAGIRPAPHGRPGHRHRPLRHAADRHGFHPRRHPLPDHEAPGRDRGQQGRKARRGAQGPGGPRSEDRLLPRGDRAALPGVRGF